MFRDSSWGMVKSQPAAEFSYFFKIYLSVAVGDFLNVVEKFIAPDFL
jgi:hypothetical protein